MEIITLGGGCYWCLDSLFSNLKGVSKSTPGFSGANGNGISQNAEVVQIEFDSNEISITDIIFSFFSIHDPTQLNKQGYDVGKSYRSIILYHNQEQKNMAEKIIKLLNEEFLDKKIVTLVQPYEEFYKANEYDNNYYFKNPNQGYCVNVIKPKLDNFKKKFDNLKKLNK